MGSYNEENYMRGPEVYRNGPRKKRLQTRKEKRRLGWRKGDGPVPNPPGEARRARKVYASGGEEGRTIGIGMMPGARGREEEEEVD